MYIFKFKRDKNQLMPQIRNGAVKRNVCKHNLA